MKKNILLITFVLLSTTLFSMDFATRDDYATVHIIRPNAFIGMAVSVEIMINQSVLIELKRDEVSKLKLDPGTYLIHLQPQEILNTKSTFFEVFKLTVEPGETINLEVSPKMYGFNYKVLEEAPNLDDYDLNDKFKWIKEHV